MALYVNPENQKLLWNLINKHEKFTEYFINKPTTNKYQWFQKCIEHMYENIKSENLTIKKLQIYNKETLVYMLNTLKELDNTINKNELMSYNNRVNIQNNLENISQKVSKSEIMNQNFNIRQKEYNDMIEKKIPESIDFRDKLDDEPISNIDEVLRTHLEMREKELKQYAPLPLIPENKIVIDNTSHCDINIENIDNEIDNEIGIDNTEVTTKGLDTKIKKYVSWEDNDIESLKKQVRELIKKTDKMQEEIDVLKYTKDIINNEYKNINNINTNGAI
jgi:hypothetical protein